jgi:hypothetical protein
MNLKKGMYGMVAGQQMEARVFEPTGSVAQAAGNACCIGCHANGQHTPNRAGDRVCLGGGAEPHAKMVVGPLIATVGFPWTVNVVVLGALVVHPALSIAVRVTPNPDGHPTAGLWQVTVT